MINSDPLLAKKVAVRNSAIHGKGLFALQKFNADDVIGRVIGREVPEGEDGPHVLCMNDGTLHFLIENDLKYINHHKQANVAYLDDFTVIALRDIQKGEELVHDYGTDWE
jgi:uncharacterized protein